MSLSYLLFLVLFPLYPAQTFSCAAIHCRQVLRHCFFFLWHLASSILSALLRLPLSINTSEILQPHNNIFWQPFVTLFINLISQADRRHSRLPCLTNRLQLTPSPIAPPPTCTLNRNIAHTMNHRARALPSPKDLLPAPRARTSQ